MNGPPPEVTPENAQRVADVIEWLAKVAGSLGVVWLFLVKVYKPYADWRQRRLGAAIRVALKAELECIGKMPHIEQQLQLVLDRQGQMFEEMDLFMTVAEENHERLEDFSGLLDEVGLASRNRREQSADRRHSVAEALHELDERRKARRRRDHHLDAERAP